MCTHTCLCVQNEQCECVQVSPPIRRRISNPGCNFYPICDLWSETEGQSHNNNVAFLNPPEAKRKSSNWTVNGCSKLRVWSLYAPVQLLQRQEAELRGIAAFRNTLIMRQMLSWNMSAHPASEASSELLPNPVSTIGLHLIALQRSSRLSSTSRFSYIRNPPDSFPCSCIYSCGFLLWFRAQTGLVSLGVIRDCSAVSKTRLVFLVVKVVSSGHKQIQINILKLLRRGEKGGGILQSKQTPEGWYWTLGFFQIGPCLEVIVCVCVCGVMLSHMQTD